jgi:hypothetical protein
MVIEVAKGTTMSPAVFRAAPANVKEQTDGSDRTVISNDHFREVIACLKIGRFHKSSASLSILAQIFKETVPGQVRIFGNILLSNMV